MAPSLLANQPLLVQVADLGRLGASSDFLAQFIPRPLSVQIVTGGALGTMTYQWQVKGDSSYSGVISSEAPGGAWSDTPPDPSYAVLTFAPGTYVINDTYNVSSTGVVTGGNNSLLTATRFDARADACIEGTSTAVTLLQPRCVPPILSVGAAISGWIYDLIMYRLRSRQGMTPPGAGSGDDNVRLRAEMARKELRAIGVSDERPPDLVDSSQGDLGAGFNAYPVGDPLVGW